ncbi:MAG: ATP-dependent Clp protease proteolytic subunit [Candidatus Yanofskybacteria bacterium]|nr:ATP-dependent Clp protease proteolytic subunit [Candidatus Yanofskybacteria bacterium]
MPRKRVSSALHEAIRAIHDWNLDVRQFAIHLTGEPRDYDDNELPDEPGVEYQMSARFIKNLQILADQDSNKPILVHMKTCGGSWTEGMAIHDAIFHAPNPIIILNYTHARSMSSIIFQAADRRVMMPHSYFMFHDGTLKLSGTYRGTLSNADWSKKEHLVMVDIYANRMKERGKFSKKTKEEIKEMLERQMNLKEDVFLTAQEAVSWGLADSIFDGNWSKLTKYIRRRSK